MVQFNRLLPIVLLIVSILVCSGKSMFHQWLLISAKNVLDYAQKGLNYSLNHELGGVFDRLISTERVVNILHTHLCMRKLCAKW